MLLTFFLYVFAWSLTQKVLYFSKGKFKLYYEQKFLLKLLLCPKQRQQNKRVRYYLLLKLKFKTILCFYLYIGKALKKKNVKMLEVKGSSLADVKVFFFYLLSSEGVSNAIFWYFMSAAR